MSTFFLPWNWLNGSAPVEALAKLYERKLIQTRLPQLPKPPARPRFVFCSAEGPMNVRL